MFQDKSSYALPSTNGNARGGKKYLFCSDTGTQIKVVIGINIVLVILTVILLVVNSLWLNPGKPKKCLFKLKFHSNFPFDYLGKIHSTQDLEKIVQPMQKMGKFHNLKQLFVMSRTR